MHTIPHQTQKKPTVSSSTSLGFLRVPLVMQNSATHYHFFRAAVDKLARLKLAAGVGPSSTFSISTLPWMHLQATNYLPLPSYSPAGVHAAEIQSPGAPNFSSALTVEETSYCFLEVPISLLLVCFNYFSKVVVLLQPGPGTPPLPYEELLNLCERTAGPTLESWGCLQQPQHHHHHDHHHHHHHHHRKRDDSLSMAMIRHCQSFAAAVAYATTVDLLQPMFGFGLGQTVKPYLRS